ncbi:hypothetical protein L2D14_04400 [Thalassospiraceae bacterium LMO-JJ14]|nr:hypothetical protein L2D14_04400 [Thalassospiraceae bacterium LMO-JJ14]
MFGIFKKKKPAPAYSGPPIDPKWERNKQGKFFRLSHLDTRAEGLQGYGGVFVIWHSGVKPQWVYVGASDDLAQAINAASDDGDIMSYEVNGGLFVSWAPILKLRRNGVMRFLIEAMQPVVENPDAKGIKDGPISVIVPKRK